MLYLGIDQHARQLTVSLRNDQGDVVQARQVSTQPEKIQEFFERLRREHLHGGELFLAVVEVCGFNDWLLQMLEEHHCHKVILIQPEERKRQKTDRRDAAALSELLWVNRERFLAGKPVHGLRQVQLPLRFRRPQAASPNGLRGNELEETQKPRAADGECERDLNSQAPSQPDTSLPQYLAVAWCHLSPHVRDAICTLVEADLQRKGVR